MKRYNVAGYSKLTASQVAVILNLKAGKRPGAGLTGRSAHGGLSTTLLSLRRRGILDADDRLVTVDLAVPR